MSKAVEQRRVRWGYEPNTPQCCNCIGYRKAKMPSPTEIVPPMCGPGGFAVQANGCCDKWKSRRGERLA